LYIHLSEIETPPDPRFFEEVIGFLSRRSADTMQIRYWVLNCLHKVAERAGTRAVAPFVGWAFPLVAAMDPDLSLMASNFLMRTGRDPQFDQLDEFFAQLQGIWRVLPPHHLSRIIPVFGFAAPHREYAGPVIEFLLNFLETVADDPALTPDIVYSSNIVMADVVKCNYNACAPLCGRLLALIDHFSARGLIGSDVALETILVIGYATISSTRLPPLLRRLEVTVETQVQTPDAMRAIVTSLQSFLALPAPEVVRFALAFLVRIFAECENVGVRCDVVRVALRAAQTSAPFLRENFAAFRKIIELVVKTIHQEDCLPKTITAAIKLMGLTIGEIGFDVFIELWHALLGGIVDAVGDEQVLEAAARMAQYLLQRFPGELEIVLARSGGTYGAVYDRLFDALGRFQVYDE
jgi:hypothetical protein